MLSQLPPMPGLYPWQAKFLQEEYKQQPKLSVLRCGRRSGKTHAALIWALTAKGGLAEGGHVCWLGPKDKTIAEARSWAKHWWGPIISGASPGAIGFDFVNGSRLDFWTAGPNSRSPVRSRGYSLAICDEAAEITELRLLLDACVRPALALSGGRILLISTPRGRNDFYDLWLEAKRGGLVFHAPSEINKALSLSELKEIRRNTAPIEFEQEYRAEFVEKSGAMMKREWLRVAPPPPIESFQTLTFGVDLAIGVRARSDFTAISICGVDALKRKWVLSVDRWRKGWMETRARLRELDRIWHPTIIVMENVSFQNLACTALSSEDGLSIVPFTVHEDKETRFLPIVAKYSMGEVWHSDTLTEEFTGELLSFPIVPHDDQVDSLVCGLMYLYAEARAEWSDRSGGNRWSQWGAVSGELPHEVLKRKEEKSERLWAQMEERARELEGQSQWEVIDIGTTGRTACVRKRSSRQEITD
jgi:phage terminase large subunit-like protein